MKAKYCYRCDFILDNGIWTTNEHQVILSPKLLAEQEIRKILYDKIYKDNDYIIENLLCRKMDIENEPMVVI